MTQVIPSAPMVPVGGTQDLECTTTETLSTFLQPLLCQEPVDSSTTLKVGKSCLGRPEDALIHPRELLLALIMQGFLKLPPTFGIIHPSKSAAFVGTQECRLHL